MKTKAERVEQMQTSAARMLKWFEELKQLPREPVQVTKHMQLIDLKKFMETQVATIEGNLKDPFNRVFRCAYLRLYTLKKFIENEQSGTNYSK